MRVGDAKREVAFEHELVLAAGIRSAKAELPRDERIKSLREIEPKRGTALGHFLNR